MRWQVRKTAPFPVEDAQVTFVPALEGPDGREYLVALARRDVVTEYEGLCGEAGGHAGLVDLSTFNVINAVLAAGAGPDADWLLVNVAADSASIAILRGPYVILFRNRAADSDGTLADLVHQTAMYYEDRLKGGGFARVIQGTEEITRGLDIVPSTRPENVRRLDAALRELGARGRDGRDLTVDEATIASQPLLELTTEHGELKDVIIDEKSVSPFKTLENSEAANRIEQVLSSLTEREEKIIRMRYGIGVEQEQTLAEVGRHFNLTIERIRQIETKVFKKLRHPAKSRALREYVRCS